jgi:general secretion pathway protein I
MVDRKKRDGSAGFTLIETLVALTVLATSAVALIGATQAHVNRIAGLEQRAAAQWAGENALAEIALGIDVTEMPATMLGYPFDLHAERTATDDPAVEKVTMRVTGADDAVMARVTGFVFGGAASGIEGP